MMREARKVMVVLVALCMTASMFVSTAFATGESSSTAETYYISPTGSDATGTGTISNPWASLYKACNSVTTAGAVIHVNAGTYVETQKCDLAVGVSVEGEGVTSIIKSHYIGREDENDDVLLWLQDGTNPGGQHISNLKFDGDNLTGGRCITIDSRSNVSIHDCTIIDFNYRGVGFKNGNQTGNAVYNNIIDNCGGYRSNSSGNWDEDSCLVVSCNTGMLIYGNTIKQLDREPGKNGVAFTAAENMYGLKIYNNTIAGLEQDKYNENWPFAMEFYAETPQGYGMEIYGNTITGECDFAGAGFYGLGDYEYSIDFHDNILGDDIIHDIDVIRSGIQFERKTSHVIIRNNIFKNLERPIYFCAFTEDEHGLDYFEDISIYNNELTNVVWGYSVKETPQGYTAHGTGIDFGGNPRSYVNNVKICDNTISAYPGRPGECGIYLPTANNVTNIDVKNNTIVGFTVAPIIAENQASGGTLDNLVLSKNIYSGNGNSNAFKTIKFTPTNVTNDNGIIDDTLAPPPTPTPTPTPQVSTENDTVVNDTVTGTGENQFEYVGTGWGSGPSTGAYLDTEHYSNTTNDYYQVDFTGTKIEVYGQKYYSIGIVAISIDGGAETNVDCYNPTKLLNTLIYTSPTLTAGKHTIKLRVTGTKNATSNDCWVVADRVVITAGTEVNDTVTGTGQNQFEYVGAGWLSGASKGAYLDTEHYSKTTNDYYQIDFTGTKIAVYSQKFNSIGIVAISIDGGAETNVDCYNPTILLNTLIYTSPTLTAGKHTIKLRVTGTKNATSNDCWVVADRVVITAGTESLPKTGGLPAVVLSGLGGVIAASGLLLRRRSSKKSR